MPRIQRHRFPAAPFTRDQAKWIRDVQDLLQALYADQQRDNDFRQAQAKAMTAVQGLLGSIAGGLTPPEGDGTAYKVYVDFGSGPTWMPGLDLRLTGDENGQLFQIVLDADTGASGMVIARDPNTRVIQGTGEDYAFHAITVDTPSHSVQSAVGDTVAGHLVWFGDYKIGLTTGIGLAPRVEFHYGTHSIFLTPEDFNGDKEVLLPNRDGALAMRSGGDTASRPSTPLLYESYFDTDLGSNGMPVWWNGTDWVDATGTIA